MNPQFANFIVPVVLLVFALRIWLAGPRARRVRIETMWIVPAIYVFLIGSAIYADPPPLRALVIGILAVALAIGLGLGWFRGRMVSITIDPKDHTLTSQQSALGMVILATIFLARAGVRLLLTDHMNDWHIPPSALADGFLLLALGSVVGRRIEILIRCLLLLKKAREGHITTEITQDHV